MTTVKHKTAASTENQELQQRRQREADGFIVPWETEDHSVVCCLHTAALGSRASETSRMCSFMTGPVAEDGRVRMG